jgi:hypothetical protein
MHPFPETGVIFEKLDLIYILCREYGKNVRMDLRPIEFN